MIQLKKKGKIIKQFTIPNGSLVSVYEYDGLEYYIDKIRVFGPFTNNHEIGDSLEQFMKSPDVEMLDASIFSVNFLVNCL